MSLVQNERIKLLATAISTTGVATVVTAFIAPIAAALYGSTTVTARGWWVISIIWLLVGFTLHLIAQAILGRLRE
jgi:Na+/melibiose symporter-like transporter